MGRRLCYPDRHQLHSHPDVAKVETFLGDAGYYKPLTNDDPNGWHSSNLDEAIRTFQKGKSLEVDGFLKPGGPTIGKIGSLLGGAEPQKKRADNTEIWGRGFNNWPGVSVSGNGSLSPRQSGGQEPSSYISDEDARRLGEILRNPPAGNSQRPDSGPPSRQPSIDPFPNHTINQEGIDASQAYAEMLVRDSDPSQTARMLKRTIDDYGDQGRGDVADLLARFQEIDGTKAETLRRELHKATGEMLPYRLAPLGEGFREPTDEEKIAAAPQVPFGSAQGADRWAAGNMADALLGKGDYVDAVSHFRGEIGRNRGEAMPYLAAVHEIMGEKNPGLAAKFATQMQKAGLTAAAEKKPEDVPQPAPAPTPAPVPEPPKPEPAPQPAPQPQPSPAPAPTPGLTPSPDGGNSSSKPQSSVGHVSSISGQEILDKAKTKGTDGIISHPKGQGCVVLVKDAVPDLADTRTTDWKPGPKIVGSDNPPLRPGTALATFGANGKYGGDGVQHAVVFDRYETRNGQPGMWIIEQSKDMPTREKFVPFNSTDSNPRYRAENYSVITK